MTREPDVFATKMVQMDSGLVTCVVEIAPEIAENYVAAKQRRVVAEIKGQQLRRYLFQSKNGEWGIIIGKDVMRKLGVRLHEPFVMEMWADPEPDRVDVPQELEAALEADPDASERFYGMTPGRQRSLCIYVDTAKRPVTREKRALELAYKLGTFTLAGDKPRN